jgi:hypothetical protein
MDSKWKDHLRWFRRNNFFLQTQTAFVGQFLPVEPISSKKENFSITQNSFYSRNLENEFDLKPDF